MNFMEAVKALMTKARYNEVKELKVFLDNFMGEGKEIYVEGCFKCAKERGDILPLRTDGMVILCNKHREYNWNLADAIEYSHEVSTGKGNESHSVKRVLDIKKFIQKSKDKIDKGMNPKQAIDETAGDL